MADRLRSREITKVRSIGWGLRGGKMDVFPEKRDGNHVGDETDESYPEMGSAGNIEGARQKGHDRGSSIQSHETYPDDGNLLILECR